MRHKPNSKRHTTPKLPDNWRYMVWSTACPNPAEFSAYRVALALHILTGLRPSELAAGVVIQRTDCGHIVVTIKGAKCGPVSTPNGMADRGIHTRIIGLMPGHLCTTYLANHYALIAAGGVFTYNAGSFRQMLLRTGYKALAGCRGAYAGVSITPYCFRHALASELKACDSIDDVVRAGVMGHACTSSLASYGRRKRGGGGACPVKAVVVSQLPRVVDKAHTRFMAFKPMGAGFGLTL